LFPRDSSMRSCTALNLTLQRFFIAPEAAGGVFAGQLLTHARLDVMTLP
jgi:hypothetical protein